MSEVRNPVDTKASTVPSMGATPSKKKAKQAARKSRRPRKKKVMESSKENDVQANPQASDAKPKKRRNRGRNRRSKRKAQNGSEKVLDDVSANAGKNNIANVKDTDLKPQQEIRQRNYSDALTGVSGEVAKVTEVPKEEVDSAAAAEAIDVKEAPKEEVEPAAAEVATVKEAPKKEVEPEAATPPLKETTATVTETKALPSVDSENTTHTDAVVAKEQLSSFEEPKVESAHCSEGPSAPLDLHSKSRNAKADECNMQCIIL